MMQTDSSETEPGSPVLRFLDEFAGADRAWAVHLALRALRGRVEPDRVVMCELAWEAHAHGYWSRVRREDGTAYDCEETYLREVLGVTSWRTAYRRLAVGRMLTSVPDPGRTALREAVGRIGVAKAAVIVPAVERTREWAGWTDLARRLTYPVLQARVSAALDALPRGVEPSPPGERFRRLVLSAMPDIEAMELADRFFEVGSTVVGTPHPIAIFIAGCRECLAEWEVQAARRWGPRGAEWRDEEPVRDNTGPKEDRDTRVRARNGAFANGGNGRRRSRRTRQGMATVANTGKVAAVPVC